MTCALTPPFTFPEMVLSYNMQHSSRERKDLFTTRLEKKKKKAPALLCVNTHLNVPIWYFTDRTENMFEFQTCWDGWDAGIIFPWGQINKTDGLNSESPNDQNAR